MPLVSDTTPPMVAVYMICYNCEAYIAQAIEGVLRQQADFAIRLFIGDDASTDATASICKAYKERFPQQIELLLHPVNIGAVNNAKTVYEACLNSGAKYVAMCEGDDYWTDPDKLQKQVRLLEANPQYSLCFHEAVLLNMETGEEELYLEYSRDVYNTEDVLRTGAFVPTLSIVFRTAGFHFPAWYFSVSIGDAALVLMNSIRGDIVLMREKMGVYRKHRAGISVAMEANQIRLALESVKLLHYFNLHTQLAFDAVVQEVNTDTLYRLKHFTPYRKVSDTRPLWQKLGAADFWKRKVKELVG
ncbi:MAG: glycosyltransferase [Chitinophagaceae bacterium]|nr:glycosyltransferase [Chitinophagaceae bacterium]